MKRIRELTEEQRNRKNERDRERRKRKKDEINAKDRERRKRKKGDMTEEEKKIFNKKAADRKRASRANQTLQKRQQELTANCARMQSRREKQSPKEKQEELAANSIRNSLAQKIPGPRVKMRIQQLKSNLSDAEKMRIVAHRNMLLARHSVPLMRSRVAGRQAQVDHWRHAREAASVLFHKGRRSERYVALISHYLEKAIKNHSIARALESYRESMRDLTQDLFDLSAIDPNLPDTTKEHLIAKRNLLQTGYDLSQSQKKLQKTLKIYEESEVEYERQLNRATDGVVTLTRDNDLMRYEQRLQEHFGIYKKAWLGVANLQKQLRRDAKIRGSKFQKYANGLGSNEDEHKLMTEQRRHAGGYLCSKCKHMWFYNYRAAFDHEELCVISADISIEPIPPSIVPVAKITVGETKQTSTEEDATGDFVHPLTGEYRTAADGVPDHINPETGYYKYGVRKCSKCKEFKDKQYFTEEEADKKPSERVCNLCIDEEESAGGSDYKSDNECADIGIERDSVVDDSFGHDYL